MKNQGAGRFSKIIKSAFIQMRKKINTSKKQPEPCTGRQGRKGLFTPQRCAQAFYRYISTVAPSTFISPIRTMTSPATEPSSRPSS